MGQLGFFDADKRLEALLARGNPLEAIDRLVPWESFRAEIEAVVLTPDELKKSSAGRKPFDAIRQERPRGESQPAGVKSHRRDVLWRFSTQHKAA